MEVKAKAEGGTREKENIKNEGFEFEKLEVYKKSLDFIDKVYNITSKFPDDEKYGLAGQFRRASVSVTLNIAEGAGRYNQREKIQFYRIARASVHECVAISQISLRRKYINDSQYSGIYHSCIELAKMISGLASAQKKRK